MTTDPSVRYPRRPLWVLAALAALFGLGLLPSREEAAVRPRSTPDHLTSQPRPETPAVKPAAIGEEIRTNAGQRRRVQLPGGSVLYVNQNSTIKLNAARKVTLSAGEVFVDVARTGKGKADAFVVKTPRGEISGETGQFAVRTAAAGTGVVVVRGQVQVGDQKDPLQAGQQQLPGKEKPVRAPRLSHVLDWTRDLMSAAETPLVPGSKHAGGALIAIDPDGQEAKLSLRKYHVDVYIDDGFARTTIDQTYFNHEDARLEGTFYFPLPADASLSRLAMYVDGNLMEGGMAERDYARQVYETIKYRQQDPALLEWIDGSTFKMRVFPLEPRQEKRIILSYTQRLPTLYGQTQYRFPAGHSLGAVRDWSFHAGVKNGAQANWSSASHTLKASRPDGDLCLDAAGKNVRLDQDVLLNFTSDDKAKPDPVARFSAAEQDGALYLMLRYRPTLPIGNRQSPIGNPKTWVFLFESSGDRNPLLARTQIEVIRHLLGHAEAGDTFTILTAGTRVRAFANEAKPVTPENAQAAMAYLEKAHLIGALDLGHALKEARAVLKDAKNPFLVHVGSGIAAMGERRENVLAKRIPEGTHYVGIGVGKRWARGFMKTAAERTGGYFTQINPDEPIAWRAFELSATLNTPRLLNIKVRDIDDKSTRFLTFANALAQGEELCAITRLDPTQEDLPEELMITGVLDGKEFETLVSVKDVTKKADYLPRTWAKLEIERLLAEDAAKHKKQIIALSKAMYVMTPFTSLLVLENEDMYTQYKVDRGRKDHWVMYPCPKKIEVVREDDPEKEGSRKGAKTAKQVLDTILVRNPLHLLSGPTDSNREKRRANIHEEYGFRGQEAVIREISPENSTMFVTGLTPTGTLVDIEKQKEQYDPARVNQVINVGNERLQERGFRVRSTTTKFDPKRVALSSIPVNPGIPGRFVSRSDHVIRSVVDKDGSISTGLGDGPEPQEPPSPMPSSVTSIRNAFISRLLDGSLHTSSWLYQRPNFSGDDRIFYDLVAYAPGMNTNATDIRAVLEAEARPSRHARLGKIDDAARRLLDKARVSGWHALAIPGEEGQPGFTIFFDGSGRYTYERVLPPGLRERVVCDGKIILHLYPELGLGARRPVTRFHRADFTMLVPWALPQAEDLAHGADLRLIDDRTVALFPHAPGINKDAKGKPISYRHVQFIFAANGRLAERQVRMPAKTILYRETYAADGTIKLLGKDGKELAVRKTTLKAAKEPSLKADTKDLVVLPLPYRTRAHVQQTLKIAKKQNQELRFKEALALFAADFAAGNGAGALNVFQQAFHSRDQRQIGFYVLLATCQNLDGDHVDVMAEHPDEPLAQYLALHTSPLLRKHASQWAVSSRQWTGAGFLKHLALSHALYQRWQDDKVVKGSPAKRQAERERAMQYVRENKGSLFGWVLLGLMQDRAGKDATFHRDLAELWPLFAEVPGLRYAARYEQARCLWKAGQKDKARKRFQDLYEETLKQDRLPLIDLAFRQALLGNGKEADPWSDLLRRTASQFVGKKRRPAVLALAWQCWQLEDRPLANHLLRIALEDIPDKKDRLPLTLAGVAFLRETGQFVQADRLLDKLLADPKLAGRAGLWRLAVGIAEQRDMTARALECLEKALEAEYQHPPAVINLKAVRQNYDKLLEHYKNLAQAMVTLQIKPPADFLTRVVRAADRWRALDPDGVQACQQAGRILQTLGRRDLGWEYLTTPVGQKPNEAGPWVDLAQMLARQGDLELADRAYTAAYETEPTNAQILWDRAQNLRQAGKTVAAQKLFRRLAEGKWQPRFQWLQTQARWQVQNR